MNYPTRPKILLCADISPETLIELLALSDVEIWKTAAEPVSAEALARNDIMILRTPHRIAQSRIPELSRLKLVIRAGSGTDGLDVEEFHRHGIEIKTLPLASTSVAEHAFGLLIAAARDILTMNAALKSGKWLKGEARGIELDGKILNVVGFGKIGRQIARIAAGFGLDLLVTDPSPEKAEKRLLLRDLPSAQVLAFDRASALADFVVLACPAKPETIAMINSASLGRMKKGVILVNVGRAELIDDHALKNALDEGRVGAATLDVHRNEPSPDPVLVCHPRVIATPHIGAQTIDARARIERAIMRIVRNQVGVEVEHA